MKGLYMALPLIAGGVMAGASVLGSIFGNQSNAEALKANIEQIQKDYAFQVGQLQEAMKGANENIGLEMAANRWNALKSAASTANTITERELVGNTAAKLYNQSTINAMFAHNSLVKKAEDTMASFGYKMDTVRQEATNAIYSANAQFKKSQISPLSMVTGAVSAGISGYSLGSGADKLFKELGSVTTTASGSMANTDFWESL